MLGYFHLHRAWREIWTQNFDPYDVRDWPAYAADLDAARQHLENAIAIDPNEPEPYRFLIRLARLVNRVTLYKVLGGGWQERS